MTDHSIELLEDKFPECLRQLQTDGQLPRTLTLKKAFEHILDNKLSLPERQKEFLKCTEQLSALTHSHEPFIPSLAVHFGELERIRRLQHIVESPDSEYKCMSYQMLCVLAHLKIHDGVGGRKDMVQESQSKWKAKSPLALTPPEQW